jgi:hypothetical protein
MHHRQATEAILLHQVDGLHHGSFVGDGDGILGHPVFDQHASLHFGWFTGENAVPALSG